MERLKLKSRMQKQQPKKKQLKRCRLVNFDWSLLLWRFAYAVVILTKWHEKSRASGIMGLCRSLAKQYNRL